MYRAGTGTKGRTLTPYGELSLTVTSASATLPPARLHVQGVARTRALTRAQRIRSRSVIVYVYVYARFRPNGADAVREA